MSKITDSALLKVKTLSRSMAKQIQFVPYKIEPGSLWNQIRDGLLDGRLKPIGWVHQDALGSSYPCGFWLVFYQARYWWFMAPNGSDLAIKFPRVEQLFV